MRPAPLLLLAALAAGCGDDVAPCADAQAPAALATCHPDHDATITPCGTSRDGFLLYACRGFVIDEGCLVAVVADGSPAVALCALSCD